jgi:predicted nucleic acid-binding protein
MRIFIDTNVLVDYLAYRKKFFENAAYIIQLGQNNKCKILVSAMSFATASFILQAHHGISEIDISKKFSEFVKKCNITAVDSKTVNESLVSGFKDFEDAMQYYSAVDGGADCIITRNKDDFSKARISVYEPIEFLDLLRKKAKRK